MPNDSERNGAASKLFAPDFEIANDMRGRGAGNKQRVNARCALSGTGEDVIPSSLPTAGTHSGTQPSTAPHAATMTAPPQFRTLEIEVAQGVARLWLSRAAKSNAFDGAMWAELPQVQRRSWRPAPAAPRATALPDTAADSRCPPHPSRRRWITWTRHRTSGR